MLTGSEKLEEQKKHSVSTSGTPKNKEQKKHTKKQKAYYFGFKKIKKQSQDNAVSGSNNETKLRKSNNLFLPHLTYSLHTCIHHRPFVYSLPLDCRQAYSLHQHAKISP